MQQPQTVKELRLAMSMTLKEFSEYFETPMRTVQRWEASPDARSYSPCPVNIFHLMLYKYESESEKGNL